MNEQQSNPAMSPVVPNLTSVNNTSVNAPIQPVNPSAMPNMSDVSQSVQEPTPQVQYAAPAQFGQATPVVEGSTQQVSSDVPPSFMTNPQVPVQPAVTTDLSSTGVPAPMGNSASSTPVQPAAEVPAAEPKKLSWFDKLLGKK